MADELNHGNPSPDEGTVVGPEAAADGPPPEGEAREHFLVVLTGVKRGQRYALGEGELVVGRKPPARLVLPDPLVSARHCGITLAADEVILTDLGSANGSYVDGRRVDRPTRLADGASLRLGDQWLRYEHRARSEVEAAGELLRDLAAAGEYLRSLLPPPGPLGPLGIDWHYQPCAQVGGDAFGCHALDGDAYAFYLIDVSGHGTPAALHTVSLLNLLRHRALPDTDPTDAAAVVARLNALFPMDAHGGMYFTIWYGVWQPATRCLHYCSAGHPPALLLAKDAAPRDLATPNLVAGALPEATFVADVVTVPRAGRLYLFSDGAYEIVTGEGRRWCLADFLPLLAGASGADPVPPAQIHARVTAAAAGGVLDDDFSLLAVDFP